ncbi:hypothetical protein MVEN_01724000 [Mycena venus]|uniref:Uncharacterized protein n=1 Tax=Mycena venus TaxID=2733690 RepID=A0A8H7CM98_9AGAR|nr:hypothetical protein MVEN_01724000 [Mycena venus]
MGPDDGSFEAPSEHLQWPMFIAAVAPNPKVVNRALLLIQGFERSEHLSDSKWTLFTSRDLPPSKPPPTSSPFSGKSPNDFAGLSHAEINDFMNEHWTRLDEMEFTFELWMILDETGLSTDTCVICKHPYKGADDDEPETWACAVYASLYTGKEFEDYLGIGKWPDGSYQFDRGCTKMKDDEALEREEIAWQLWRSQGFVY